MELLAREEVCVVEDGGWCNLIHVDDLVESVRCGLETERGFGQPLFVTDGAPLKWSEYIEAHARLLGTKAPRRTSAEALPVELDWRGWMRASVRPLGAIVKSNEFRSFVFESPAARATLFRVTSRCVRKNACGLTLETKVGRVGRRRADGETSTRRGRCCNCRSRGSVPRAPKPR